MPEGFVMQLLACNEQDRGELKTLLKEYREVFPTELPKKVLSNHGLGEEMEIKLWQEQNPSDKRCIRYLQQNNWQ